MYWRSLSASGAGGGAGAGAAVSSCPHVEQNRASGSTSAVQLGHVVDPRVVPHALQNRASALFSVEQLGQTVAIIPHDPSGAAV
jgi:hypothetical protein